MARHPGVMLQAVLTYELQDRKLGERWNRGDGGVTCKGKVGGRAPLHVLPELGCLAGHPASELWLRMRQIPTRCSHGGE